MHVAVVSIIEAHWGWSVRGPGYSAGGPALPLPPPSTVASAILSYAISSSNIPEMYRDPRGTLAYSSKIASEALVTASAGLLEGYVAIIRDTMKYLAIPYLNPGNREDPSRWFAAQAFGVAFTLNAKLCLAAVYDKEVLEKYNIDLKLLDASARSMTRLGSREGLITVKDAVVVDAKEVQAKGKEETVLYAPQGVLEATGKTRLYPMEIWDPKNPVAYSPLSFSKKRLSLPETLIVEIPVDVLSGGDLLVAPRKPARIKANTTIFRAGNAPDERCGYIPAVILKFDGEG